MNVERLTLQDERSDHAEQLCASLRLCVRSKIISVNFPTGWSESKAIRNSVCSVISVCHQIRADTRDTWKQIINVIKQMKQFHLTGTDVRRVRPQSIKISLLNVREIKDARTVRPYLPSVHSFSSAKICYICTIC